MPRDDDDLLNDLVEQVQSALETLRSDDGRDALLDGIKEALQQVGVDGPEVVVYDGGREESEGLDDDGKPDLRVVEDQDTGPEPERRPRVSVRTMRRPRVVPDPSRAGRITLSGRPDGAREEEGPWQTVYRGTSSRLYRLVADTGALEVAVDGDLVERIEPGQSVDLEGCLIRVRAGDQRGATGLYTGLHE